MTFKILFGEAMIFKCLNQRKEDSSTVLNLLKDKETGSYIPLAITNDMIAMASNWEGRLRPPERDKE